MTELSGTVAGRAGLRAAEPVPAGRQGRGLDHDAAAERLYRRALDEEPENARALEALEALYRDAGRTPSPNGWPRSSSSGAPSEMDSERRQALYAEAARIHEKLGDTTAAIAAWQAVRDGDEGNAEALDELARLLGQQGNNQELVAVLEDRARFSDSREERAALFFRIGELRRGPLEDTEGAATAFKEVLDIVPDDRRALEALAALEEKRGDFAALEEVLLRRLSVVEGGERVETLLALAKQRRGAAGRQRSGDQLPAPDPGDRPGEPRGLPGADPPAGARTSAGTTSSSCTSGGPPPRAQRDPDAEIACRLAIAELWGRRLDDDDSAREAIEKVLDLQAQPRPALLALAAVHERAEAWARGGRGPGEGGGGLRDGARSGRGALPAQPGAGGPGGVRRSRSRRRCGRRWRPTPSHVEALKAAEERARKQGDSGPAGAVAGGAGRAWPPAAERKPLLAEIATLYRGPLAAPDRAVTALTELAQQEPGDAQVQEDLAGGAGWPPAGPTRPRSC